MTDFFMWLQRLSQEEDSGIEIFIDEDGEVEFEIDSDIFLKLMDKYNNETKD